MESNFSIRYHIKVYSWTMIFFIVLELIFLAGSLSLLSYLFVESFPLKMAFISFSIVASAAFLLLVRRYRILKFLETRFGERKDFLELTSTSFSIPHMYFVKKSYSRNLARIPLKDVISVIRNKNHHELKIKFKFEGHEHLLKLTPDHIVGGEDEFVEISNYFKNMCT